MRTFVISLLAFGLLLPLQFFSPAFAAEQGGDDRLVWASEDGTVGFVWRLRLRHAGADLDVSMQYPQGLGGAVDAAVAGAARARFDRDVADYQEYALTMAEEARSGVLELVSRKGRIDEYKENSREAFCNTAYSLSRPSAGLVSILYTTEEYGGGAHGNVRMDTVSYNLASGNELTLQDVFSDEAAALAWLGPRIAWDVQRQKEKKPKNIKEFDPGKVGGDELASVDIRMERILLTPRGMSVVYPPYVMGSYAEGSFVVDIPKEELLAKGANPAIWK